MARDTKTPGAALCLEFAAACMRRGAVVSEPYADNAPYDLVVDAGGKLYRVQVKVTNQKKKTFNGTKKVPTAATKETGPRPSSKSVPYATNSIDAAVTRLDTCWYIYPGDTDFKQTHTVNEHGPEKENWSTLGLQK